MGRHLIARDDLLTLSKAAAFTGLSWRQLQYLAETRQIAYETRTVGRPVKKFRRSVLLGLMQKHEPIPS